MAESVRYIQLEETSDTRSLLDIKNSLRIVPCDNAIFAYSHGSIIKVFSNEGKYIKSIGSIGNGPGEFVRIDHLSSNFEADGVWILDRYQHRLIEIGIDGIVKRSFSVNNNGVRFAISPKNEIYLLCPERVRENMDKSCIEIINMEGTVIRQFPLYRNRSFGVGQISAKKQNFYFQQDQLYHSDQPFDTLYTLTKDTIWEAMHILDLGPNKIKLEDMTDPRKMLTLRDKQAHFINLLDQPSHIFMTVRNQDVYTCIIIDKLNNECHIASRFFKNNGDIMSKSGLKNDIDGGLPFWPMGMKNRQVMFRFFNPFQFHKYFEENGIHQSFIHTSSELQQFLTTYKLYGNPILMFVKLKVP